MNTPSFVTPENSDYVDIAEVPENEDSFEVELIFTNGRGKDIDRQEILLFNTLKE